MALAAPILSTLKMLPNRPGIYKYFDDKGVIIYVGKAKNLKKRVASYFNKVHTDSRKTAVLVSKICKIDFTVVDTEMDALFLENSIIKQLQPRYNVLLKDDKSYPFVRITKERFPKVYAMRNPVYDGSEYFGPYSNNRVMHMALELIKKLYPVRNCTLNLTEKNIEEGKFKLCLEYQIGNCKGPCVGLQSEQDYMDSIKNIRHLLRGNLLEVKTNIKSLMDLAAINMQFEEAHALKLKLEMLEQYHSKSTIVSHSLGDVDVFGISSTESTAFVNYLKVNNGLVVHTLNLEYRKKLNETDSEILELAIVEIRERYQSQSKEVIVPYLPEFDSKIFKLTIPSNGDKKKLLDLALKNAIYFKKEKMEQYEKLNPELKVDRLMEKMQSDLRLTEQPRHIECFDNSNIQGHEPVSACVVFKDGKPSKKDYRHFNVKTVVGPDDFATMREVILRRYKRLIDENQPLPQLIVIDGGKGQLSAAVESLKELNIYGKLAILGIAKRLEELYFPEDPLPLYLDKKSETLKVIQQMRDEAHRFGITHHRNRRSAGATKSELELIDGIGPKTIELLLGYFKSVKKIKESSFSDMEPIIGKQKANMVLNYFNNNYGSQV